MPSSPNAANGSTASSPPAGLPRAAAEAVEEYLPKAAKLKELQTAIMLEDLRALAQRDREVVRRYEDRKLFGDQPTPSQEADMGDILIADNITVGAEARAGPLQAATPPTTSAWKRAGQVAAIAAALGGLPLAGVGLNALWQRPASEQNQPAEPTEISIPAYGLDIEVEPPK